MSEEPPRKRMVRPPTGGGSGRGTATRLKTAKIRTPSSQAWLERQLNDPFVALAKRQGYRSRAAFKLLEMDERLKLVRPGARVIDLGCAPGGWLQVAQERGAGAIVGVDLLPVDPMAGVVLFEADFTDPPVAGQLLAALGGAPDLVLSDMAPNTMGHRKTDHLRIIGLIEAAADFAIANLKPGGHFLTKAFQGGETSAIIGLLKQRFADVRTIKPKASRAESTEVYLVAKSRTGAS